MASEPTPNVSKPGPSAEADAVARVLASQSLAKSERARTLLSYLYDKHVSGEADQVKGFTIAMDVFGRDENFDPNNDALVRVHMGRLRDLLANYYSGEGAGDPVSVTVPKGRYVLQFNAVEPLAVSADVSSGKMASEADALQNSQTTAGATLATAPAKDQAQGPNFTRRATIAALAVAATLALVATIAFPDLFSPAGSDIALDDFSQPVSQSRTSSVLRSLQGVPGVQFLPRLTFAHSRGNEYVESGQDPFALQLRASLARFDTIQLVANGPVANLEAPRDVGRSYYTLWLNELGSDGDGVDTNTSYGDTRSYLSPTHRLELRHPNTGDILWTQFLTRRQTGLGLGEDGRGANFDAELTVLASRIASMDGLLISHFVSVAGSNRLFDCLSLVSPIVQDLPPSSAQAAVTCLGRLVAGGNRLPITYSFLALAIMESARSGSAEMAAGLIQVDSVAEEANSVLQQGLLTTPESAALYSVQAHTQLFQTGNHEEALRLSLAAIELSDASWAIWGLHARLLAIAGQPEEANGIIDALEQETGRLAPNWAFTRFLTSLVSGDVAGLQSAASRIGGVSNPFYYSARIIAAHRRNDFLKRDELIERLRLSYPAFYANPPIFIRSMRLNSELQEEILSSLRKAGVYRLG
ncbi:MAG: hypothetical protein AAF737_03445 [Pseudomonadota bacterium]